MAYERFPYTDFHDLNLDWILGKVKELDGKINDNIAEVIREQLQTLFLDIVYVQSTETIRFELDF
jgi:hypothetical protein